MNDLQNRELEILKEFDRVCKKNNLNYTISSGTMLGAVRHKGFIPWDDDIDVMMPTKDYKRFCKVAPKELGDKFFWQTSYTDHWYAAFGKLRMNGTTAIEKDMEHCNFHQGIWIDVFPVVGVPDNEKIIKLMNKAYRLRCILTKDCFYAEIFRSRPVLFRTIKALLFLTLPIRRFICKILECFIFKDRPDSEYFCDILPGGNIYKKFETKDIRKYTALQFEDGFFSTAAGYDNMLKFLYGDYMTPPPVEKRNGGEHVITIVDVDNDYHKYLSL